MCQNLYLLYFSDLFTLMKWRYPHNKNDDDDDNDDSDKAKLLNY